MSTVSVARALLVTTRPRQWIKNLLVAAAPMAAGVIGRPVVLEKVLIAFVAFVLASSAVYVVNDLLDLEIDRTHPKKRRRPLASGALPVPVARVAAPVFGVLALAVAATCNWALVGLTAIYLVSSLMYSIRLKHEAILDLAFIVIGFLLRALAGAVAADVRTSTWFVLTTGIGALFVIAGKRYAELELAERGLTTARPVLRHYTVSFLRFVWTMAAAALLVTYSLWAFSVGSGVEDSLWSQLSVLPFLLVLLRYALIIDRGDAGEPEEIVLSDRLLLGLAVCWLVLLVGGVYL
ncbi:MAG: decaprenyl-phosphate phosphoribosyltransferase [Propionibacterium sp.]|nr:decaprenyl-phosphate phosphoribosyltransferase [Propionibacterium sp.]